jgi:hypothetical protein
MHRELPLNGPGESPVDRIKICALNAAHVIRRFTLADVCYLLSNATIAPYSADIATAINEYRKQSHAQQPISELEIAVFHCQQGNQRSFEEAIHKEVL